MLSQFTGPKSVEAQVQGTVRINCSVVWDPASELEVSWKKDNVRYYALKLIVLYQLQCLIFLVYNRNHLYFGFGPISKPKLADTFGRYPNRYRNHIHSGESSHWFWNNLALIWGIFSIIKGPVKQNLLPNMKCLWLFLKIWVYL